MLLNMLIFRSFLILSLAIFVGTSKLFGESCRRNSDCLNSFTHCKIISPSCGHGTCVCLPGYTLDAAQCKVRRFYGEKCDPDGVLTACVGVDNIECSSKTKQCECSTGYRYGPSGIDSFACIPETMNLTREAKCYDSIQCLFGMACADNVCQCQPWQRPVGPYGCETRQLGQSCTKDEECAGVPLARCNGYNQTCTCGEGSRHYDYMDEYGVRKQICVEVPEWLWYNETINLLGAEQQSCNVWASRGPLAPCRMPLMCTYCGDGQTICARPNTIYAMSSSVRLSASTFVTSLLILAKLL